MQDKVGDCSEITCISNYNLLMSMLAQHTTVRSQLSMNSKKPNLILHQLTEAPSSHTSQQATAAYSLQTSTGPETTQLHLIAAAPQVFQAGSAIALGFLHSILNNITLSPSICSLFCLYCFIYQVFVLSSFFCSL